MTRDEAQALSNEEARLWDFKQSAYNAWVDRNSDEQYAAWGESIGAWSDVHIKLHFARQDYPHLFAPFSEKW